MTTAPTIFYFPAIQQDTLIRTQQRPNQPLPGITLPQKQLNLERAQEVIKQFEQREQEIIASQQRTVRLRSKPEETVGKPSIEVDTLMAKYQNIGCSPRVNFPDTFTLTILERYYQPIISTMTPLNAADTTYVSLLDSLHVTIPVTTVELPAAMSRFSGAARQEGYPASVTLFIICALILFAVIRFHFGRNLIETFRSAFNFQKSMHLFEERRETDRHAAILSNILFTIVSGIFISLALPFWGANPIWESYTLSLLFFSFATGLLYFLKARIWQVLGAVFNVQVLSGLYIHNMFLYNRNAGLLILPIVAILPYISETITPYLIYAAISVFLIFYLLRLWRFFQIIHDQNVSVLYFILYLCALEILPLLLFVKSCKVLSEFNLLQ